MALRACQMSALLDRLASAPSRMKPVIKHAPMHGSTFLPGRRIHWLIRVWSGRYPCPCHALGTSTCAPFLPVRAQSLCEECVRAARTCASAPPSLRAVLRLLAAFQPRQ
eukprot:1571646-Pleurochrysis_carterae.AAC.2